MKSSGKSAFTLIELLVVIAIIGILSSLVLTTLENARTQARATNAVQMLQQIEKAFQVEYASNVQYPNEGIFSSGSNPTINDIVDNGYLTSTLSPDVDYSLLGSEVRYENDGDSRTECGDAGHGASFYVSSISSDNSDVLNEIEAFVDNDDGNCGTIQISSGNLFYRIANDPNQFP